MNQKIVVCVLTVLFCLQFETVEPVSYVAPVTGNQEVDATNRTLAQIYTDVAGYRRSIYMQRNGNAIRDLKSFNRAVAGLRTLITEQLEVAKGIRQGMAPGAAFPEPEAFKKDM